MKAVENEDAKTTEALWNAVDAAWTENVDEKDNLLKAAKAKFDAKGDNLLKAAKAKAAAAKAKAAALEKLCGVGWLWILMQV